MKHHVASSTFTPEGLMSLAGVCACSVLFGCAAYELVGSGTSESSRVFVELGAVSAGLCAGFWLRRQLWFARFFALTAATILVRVVLELVAARHDEVIPVTATVFVACVVTFYVIEARAAAQPLLGASAAAVLLLSHLGLVELAIPEAPESHHVPTVVRGMSSTHVVRAVSCAYGSRFISNPGGCLCTTPELAAFRFVERHYPGLSPVERMSLAIRLSHPCRRPVAYAEHAQTIAAPPDHRLALGLVGVGLMAALLGAALVRQRTVSMKL